MVHLNLDSAVQSLFKQKTPKQKLSEFSDNALASSKDPDKLLARNAGVLRAPHYQSNTTTRDILTGQAQPHIPALLKAIYTLPQNKILVIGEHDLTRKYSAHRNRNTNTQAFAVVDTAPVIRKLLNRNDGRINKEDLAAYNVTVGDMVYEWVNQSNQLHADGPLLGYRWGNQGAEWNSLVLGSSLRVLQNHAGFVVGIDNANTVLNKSSSTQKQRSDARQKIRRYESDMLRYDTQTFLDVLEQTDYSIEDLVISETQKKDFGISAKRPYLIGQSTQRVAEKILSVPRISDMNSRVQTYLYDAPAARKGHEAAMYSWQYAMDFKAEDIKAPTFQGNTLGSSRRFRHAPSEVIAAWHTFRKILSTRNPITIKEEIDGKPLYSTVANDFSVLDMPYVIPSSETMKVFNTARSQVLKVSFDNKKPQWSLKNLSHQDISALLGYHTLANKNRIEQVWYRSTEQTRTDNPMDYAISLE